MAIILTILGTILTIGLGAYLGVMLAAYLDRKPKFPNDGYLSEGLERYEKHNSKKHAQKKS